jgi:hypothetical protein
MLPARSKPLPSHERHSDGERRAAKRNAALQQ